MAFKTFLHLALLYSVHIIAMLWRKWQQSFENYDEKVEKFGSKLWSVWALTLTLKHWRKVKYKPAKLIFDLFLFATLSSFGSFWCVIQHFPESWNSICYLFQQQNKNESNNLAEPPPHVFSNCGLKFCK